MREARGTQSILLFRLDNLRNLQAIPGKVSFTFDSWTSEPGDPYLSITGHYIDSPEDNPQKWELREEQLAFTSIEGNHSGSNIANILFQTVEHYNISDKVCG